jgi:hypothetical protein
MRKVRTGGFCRYYVRLRGCVRFTLLREGDEVKVLVSQKKMIPPRLTNFFPLRIEKALTAERSIMVCFLKIDMKRN